jgi:hypothetical protein
MCVSLRLSCCRTVKRRPDPEGVAKFVNELLALLAPAIFDAQGRGHSFGRDADGGKAGVQHVAEAGAAIAGQVGPQRQPAASRTSVADEGAVHQINANLFAPAT